jgi:diaminopimelate decarboxylase
LPKVVSGDLALIGGTGAYCASMSAKNYNSFPEAPEVLIGRNQAVHLIRRRQTLEQMLANEIVPEGL